VVTAVNWCLQKMARNSCMKELSQDLALALALPGALITLIASFLPRFFVSELAVSSDRGVFLLCETRATQLLCHQQLLEDWTQMGAVISSRATNPWEVSGKLRGDRFTIYLTNEQSPGAMECFAAAHVAALRGVSHAFASEKLKACRARMPWEWSCELHVIA
jgi:hypothetical protein